MATSIYKFDGTLLTAVPDGTIDITHSTLQFPGKGYQNYGKALLQDILWTMTHFAGSTKPTLALVGQGWFDTTTGLLKVFNGDQWISTGGAQLSNTRPATGQSIGEFWYDTANYQMNVWNGTAWDLVGPLGSATNTDPTNPTTPTNSAIDSVRLSDGAINHQVWRITVGGHLMAIISYDSFTPNPAVTGFSTISPGINFSSSISGIGVSGDTKTFSGTKDNLPATDNAWSFGSSSLRFKNYWGMTGQFSTGVAINGTVGSYALQVNGTSLLNGTTTLAVGSASAAPILMQPSTALLTTPSVGAIEFDGSNFYLTTNVSGTPTRQVIALSARGGTTFTTDVSFTSTTKSTADNNGAVTIAGGLGVVGNVVTGTQFLSNTADAAGFPGYTWAADSSSGFFQVSTGVLGFANLGTESMRIDSQGRVGIGTTSISNLLEIGKNQNSATTMRVINQNAGASASAQLVLASGSTPGYTTYNTTNTYNQIIGTAGVVTNYVDFDTHVFRNIAGTEGMRLAVGNLTVANTVTATSIVSNNSNFTGFRSRLNNGQMRIDQRGVGSGSATFSCYIAGTTMTVSGTVTGKIYVGMVLYITAPTSGFVTNTYITALGTGTGGVGTYTVSATQTVASSGTPTANIYAKGLIMLANRAFPVDRWKSDSLGQTWGTAQLSGERSIDVPGNTIFTSSLKLTVLTADIALANTDGYVLNQVIEGFNVADAGWGTLAAQPVTVSFWAKTSVTGLYSLSISDGLTRSYVATYNVVGANAWYQYSATIPGDTIGTSWNKDNTAGMILSFDLGSGSNLNGTAGGWRSAVASRTSGTVNWLSTAGATWLITGVQLEVGSVATSFEVQPYAVSLTRAQRYYEIVRAGGGMAWSSDTRVAVATYKTTKRITNPTVSLWYKYSENPASSTWNASNIDDQGFEIVRSAVYTTMFIDALWAVDAEL